MRNDVGKPTERQGSCGKTAAKAVLMGAGMLLGLILVFWLVLIAVYAIPSSLVKGHAMEAAEILQSEGEYPRSYASGKTMDNYTVAIMLSEASQASDNPVTDSLKSNRWVGGANPADTVTRGLSGSGDISVEPYSRYWHGYLVIIKPLLAFMGLHSIRMLFQFLLVVTMSVFSVLSVLRLKRVGPYVALSCIVAFAALDCLDASACLPFFFSFELGAASMILMLFVDAGNTRRVALVFLVVGALTVFFDFLDNPILTLGLPLAVLIVREWDSPSEGCKGLLGRIVLFCLTWGIGYGGAWAGKWILASVVLGQDVLGNAWENAALRSGVGETALGNGGHGLSRFFVPISNIVQMGIPLVIGLISVVCAGLFLAVLSRQRNPQLRKSNVIFVSLFLIAFLPVLWMLAFSNHSWVHGFVYRDYVVSAFCILAAFSVALIDFRGAGRMDVA